MITIESTAQFRHIVFFSNGSLGDFLMALYALENMHENNPAARVTVVVPRNRKLFTEFLDNYSYVHIIQADRSSVSGVLDSISLSRFAFVPNIVIVPFTSRTLPWGVRIAAWLSALHSDSLYVAFNDEDKELKHGKQILVPFTVEQAFSESMRLVVRAAGYEVKIERPELHLMEEKGALGKWNLIKGCYLVLHPFGARDWRSVHGEKLVKLIELLKQRLPDTVVVLSGSKVDAPRIEQAIRGASFSEKNGVLNMAGALSMKELGTVIKNSCFFIGVDTGVSHIASMLGMRGVVIPPQQGEKRMWLDAYNEQIAVIAPDAKEASAQEIMDALLPYLTNSPCR